jgi:hypothetical protein
LFKDATAAASCSASGADRLVIDVPNSRRESSSSCGRAGVEHRVDRALAPEADQAALEIEPSAGEIVGAAHQIGAAGDAWLGDGAADFQVRAPLAVDAEAGDREAAGRIDIQVQPPRGEAARHRALVGRAVELSHIEAGELRGGADAAEAEGAGDEPHLAGDRAVLPV